MSVDFPVDGEDFVQRCSRFFGRASREDKGKLKIPKLIELFDAVMQYDEPTSRSILEAWQQDQTLLAAPLKDAADRGHERYNARSTGLTLPEFSEPHVVAYTHNTILDVRSILGIDRLEVPEAVWHVDSLYRDYEATIAGSRVREESKM